MPSRTTVLLSAALLAATGLAVSASVAPTPAYAASCSTSSENKPDFDGGQGNSPDLAVGIPDEDLGTQANAGAVEVRYAGNTHKILYPSDYKAGDRFGAATVAGDFNQDHCTDLLVGAPGRDVAGQNDAGAVFVYLGSTSGLRYSRTLVQGSGGVPGAPQAGARFGSSVAYGGPEAYQSPVREFFVGAPGWNVGSATAAGAVTEVKVDTSTAGVAGSLFTQGSDGVPDTAEAGDRWGTSLVARDSGFAAGAPAESVGSAAGAGAVIERSTTDEGTQWTLLTQDTSYMPGTAEPNDHFGAALAYAGTHLVIGVPGEDLGTVADAGLIDAVSYVFTNDMDYLPAGVELTQNSPDVIGAAEAGDQFGAALAVWHPYWEDQDEQYDAIQVGTPGEDIGTVKDAGMIVTVRFHVGYEATDHPLQGNGGLSADQTAGTVEAGDRFGATLQSFRRGTGGDNPWDESALWAIGSPGEDGGAGAVVIADTGSQGLTLASSSIWKQVTGSPEAGDNYGLSIAGMLR